MRRVPTRLEGPVLLEPKVHRDHRGFFAETSRRNELADCGVVDDFVQDNHSRSTRGVVRGIHFAVGEGQAKLVRCARGSIFDVVVDLRRSSPTYGQWEAFTLDDQDLRLIYLPIGFGHGFCVTSEVADVVYRLSTYYDPEIERGFAPTDPDVGIEWPPGELVFSERDANAPRLAQIAEELPF